jgi:hypothetical protein
MVDRLDDPEFIARHEHDLESIYHAWFTRHIDRVTGLVRRHVRGDWMDTVRRPSSTYNNLCALRAYAVAERLGLRSAPTPISAATGGLLEARWRDTFLRDHADARGTLTADANLPALYFGVLPAWTRRRIAETLEESPLTQPVAMLSRERGYLRNMLPFFGRLVPSYHSTIWTHLGLMYAIGRRNEGLPWRHHVESLERIMLHHGTFLETLEPDGRPHVSRHMATEYHFTMSAGLYLEAIGADVKRHA